MIERERERERQRERQRDRQTDRQTERSTYYNILPTYTDRRKERLEVGMGHTA